MQPGLRHSFWAYGTYDAVVPQYEGAPAHLNRTVALVDPSVAVLTLPQFALYDIATPEVS